jgi:AraC-like DNA-binding protein
VPRLISTLALLAAALPRAGQTAPSSVTIIRPAPQSVITTNSLIFEADARLANDTVACMEFRANYFTAGYQVGSTGNFYQYASDTLLAVDSTPPYQWIWDISSIQDHYLGRMVVFFVARGRHGSEASAQTNDFTVDRTPDSRPRKHLVALPGRPPDSLAVCASQPGQQFMNGDNTVTFQVWWTADTLYVLTEVVDRRVLPYLGPDRSWWNGDDVELFIDARNRRSPLPDSNVYQVALRPDGLGYGGHVSLFDSLRFEAPTRARRSADGYVLAAAIPWQSLGVRPRPGMALAFELANVDLDKRDGLYSLGSWNGLHMGNLHNPSEWGELTLARPPWQARLLAGLGVLLAVGLAVLLARRRRRREDVPQRPAAGVAAPPVLSPGSASAITTAALELVRTEFQSEKLNLQSAAGKLRKNPKYVSTVFKKDMSMNFTAYLNKVRLEKADELLRTTDRSISQISIEVGYNSYKYFSAVYRKYFGRNPSQVRK